MPAELVIVSGPFAGNRYPLGAEVLEIGHSPAAAITLEGPGVAEHHCSVRLQDGVWQVVALNRTSHTYVNGMRVDQERLSDGDQISVGDHDLIFRPAESGVVEAGTRPALLRACSLLFLFRALVSAEVRSAASVLEEQLVRLIGDLVPIKSGGVVLGKGEAAVRVSAVERGSSIGQAIARACSEGFADNTEHDLIALPIYARDRIAGAIYVKPLPNRSDEVTELLSAVAVLAAAAIDSVRESQALKNQNTLLLDQLGDTEKSLVGEGGAMQRLRQMIQRVAPHDTTVLITGESGTGKELVARALHSHSGRRNAPFVAVNCAVLSENLLESELFGHEKGAFTGALNQKKGKFELAEGGTVFLDEIGELAIGLQAKLLRVLQEREFERVGGTRTYALDIRLIAATNRDLVSETARGAFREDLFHRLNVVGLRTPPLREHPEDIVPLAHYFLKRSAERCKRRVVGISVDSQRLLGVYSWPGNVRELENAMERAVVLGSAEEVLPEDLPDSVLQAVPVTSGDSRTLQNSVGNARRESILRAWEQSGGDYKSAAAILEMHPNSLLRLIRTLGLRDSLK